VGVTFLEETFGASSAPAEHRLHQKAAQAVLKALLPRSGTDIKGQMRSEAELREASGYAGRPHDFDDVIRILDHELRLITPTDPEGKDQGERLKDEPENPSSDSSFILHPSSFRYYQLTHDYLVHSLRDWLTRKQRQTRKGRAEIRLAERSTIWNAKPENRHLPSIWEWTNIRLLTRKRDWTEPQTKMMRALTKYYAKYCAVRASAAIVLLVVGGWWAYEALMPYTARTLVAELQSEETRDVPKTVELLKGFGRWANPMLRRMIQQSREDSKERLHASLALLPVDATQLDYLSKRLLSADPSEVRALRDVLKTHRSTLTPELWSVLDSAKPGDVGLLRSAGALALYDPANPRWSDVEGKVAQALATVNPIFLGAWLEALRPVQGRLTAPLAEIFRDKARPESEHTLATNILADYAADDPERLADLLMAADSKAYVTLFPVAERQAAKTLPVFRAELAKHATFDRSDPLLEEEVKDRLAERQARAAVALVRLGRAEEVFPLLIHSADPRLRSFIVNWLNPLGADPKLLIAELERIGPGAQPTPAPGQQAMDAILFHPETSIRRALILALGTFNTEVLPHGEREPLLVGKLLDLYRNDPDSGIHGAAEWTLRKWGQQGKFKEVDAKLLKVKDQGNRRWFVNGQGQTFVIVEGPVEFRMGSPASEPDRDPDEIPHRRVIPRRFAIAAKEVSVEQYQRFVNTNPQFGHDPSSLTRFSPDPSGPMVGVDWYGAAAYCNWLSEQEGLPEEQWCYRRNATGAYAEGMTIPANVLERSGYRLPTEAEWEYACRSGTMTSRYYGISTDLLATYARYQANSREHAWPCGSLLPNDLGLFDILGNAYEWCQDAFGRNGSADTESNDHVIRIDYINEKAFRFLRGGALTYRPACVRSADRNGEAPSDGGTDFGFRLARTCR
jgi:eukaryotic-like serine/threonine-protein kinase